VGTWALDRTFDSPEQPFIAFEKDNTWSASDGCNRVIGTWQLGAAGALTTTAGPQTLMACDGAQLPLAVARADSVSVDGDALTIHSSFDSTTTNLVRATDPKIGPQGLPIGYWVEKLGTPTPFLSISANRSFTGNDGCNTVFGSWTAADDGAVQFINVGSTLMACDGVDQWLSKLSLGRVQAGVMTIQSADGTVLGQLTGK
jgi:heat shock protein HslJ